MPQNVAHTEPLTPCHTPGKQDLPLRRRRVRVQYQLARRLAERILGMTVHEWAISKVEAGMSFDQITHELSAELGTDISRETARRWFYDSAPKNYPPPD